ncbi:MAG: 1-deoxy-D-xylulose-5-phosphate reductoisomerase [Bacillota bacterium]|nr:1-deoxy-D-xylulose-5-phosphate reductoisomerase [Bacillota bacterium]
MQPSQVTIIGATGSIGKLALEVIEQSPELRLRAFSFHSNLQLAERIMHRHRPARVVTTDPNCYGALREIASSLGIECAGDMDGVCDLAQDAQTDIVLTSVVGDIGIRPTVAAIEAKKTIALANKETLVAAGDLIMPLAAKRGAEIIPVDSEHSAIDQCLQGRGDNPVETIWLTASGGAFRDRSRAEIAVLGASEALKHPNWNMGGKITIDSATLMNKGLELIEAMHLFDLPPERIEIRIHPQSVVHSMVQYSDGCVIAQLGRPDMREPIAYALHRRRRRYDSGVRLDFVGMSLTFDSPDADRFPALGIARRAAELRGSVPAVMNAANEVAVAAYLRDEIRFYDITDLVQRTIDAVPYETLHSFEQLERILVEARRITEENLCRLQSSALR